MKTKELIRLLQEEDPTGEVEVCVGNVDIHFVSREPAYYDGTLQVLDRDENNKFYNITGGRYKRTGNKVVIHPLSIADAIGNVYDMPVDYSELSPDRAAAMKKVHDDLRQWHRNMDNVNELSYFMEWVKSKTDLLTVDTEDVERVANEFFEKHVFATDPLPGNYGSYVDRRKAQWDEKFQVTVTDGFFGIDVK